ncbi:hypothetical protein GCM10020000_61670 [Streptomyces olivoverticillatus]
MGPTATLEIIRSVNSCTSAGPPTFTSPLYVMIPAYSGGRAGSGPPVHCSAESSRRPSEPAQQVGGGAGDGQRFAFGAARGPAGAAGGGQAQRREAVVAREAVREELDLAGGEFGREVLQLVADAQVDVVELDLDQAAEGDAGGAVGDAVAQGDRAGPVGRGGGHLQEVAPGLAHVGELDVQGAGRVALDVRVADLGARVHGAALQDVHEGVRVAGEVGEDMAAGPAGQP